MQSRREDLVRCDDDRAAVYIPLRRLARGRLDLVPAGEGREEGVEGEVGQRGEPEEEELDEEGAEEFDLLGRRGGDSFGPSLREEGFQLVHCVFDSRCFFFWGGGGGIFVNSWRRYAREEMNDYKQRGRMWGISSRTIVYASQILIENEYT